MVPRLDAATRRPNRITRRRRVDISGQALDNRCTMWRDEISLGATAIPTTEPVVGGSSLARVVGLVVLLPITRTRGS